MLQKYILFLFSKIQINTISFKSIFHPKIWIIQILGFFYRITHFSQSKISFLNLLTFLYLQPLWPYVIFIIRKKIMKKALVLISMVVVISIYLWPKLELSPAHKRWLEDVSPIITKTEKEIFLKLNSNQERNRFIQLFWKQRDPLPDTPQNEFYQKYMARVRFADSHFGRQSSRRGSQTARGYFYLLLGPPLERQIFNTSSEIWPLELWYYKGEERFGLPPYFYLIFYQPQGIGEYRLYHPGAEGPERLVIPSVFKQRLSRDLAFNIIKKISAELAEASLSYLPGEKPLGMASFSSEKIIADVFSLAEKKFSDAYARSYLYYKDYVETEYTHKFIEVNFKLKVFKNFNQFFLHWAIEPKKINFAFYNDEYYAAYQLIMRIETTDGQLIYEKEENILLKISPLQYKNHAQRPFSFQDILPVISGHFKIFFLLKNKTSQDFSSFQTEITVPSEIDSPFLTDLLLYHQRQKVPGQEPLQFKAFSFHGFQYLINAQNQFLTTEKLGIFCQLLTAPSEFDPKKAFGLVQIYSLRNKGVAFNQKWPFKEIYNPETKDLDIDLISLNSLDPGYYQIKFSILNSQDKEILSRKENFILLSQPYPIMPWIYSRSHFSFPDPEHLYPLSLQYFMTAKYVQAKIYLEQSLKLKDDPKVRLLLAKTLYGLQKFSDSLAWVIPLFQKTKNREVAKVIALDYVGLKNWAQALIYLEQLLSQATEVSVLNLAAECYLNLNKPQKALALIQKSLRLKPDQPQIKKLEIKIKKKV